MNNPIYFNRPAFLGKEFAYLSEAITNLTGISGNGVFVKRCEEWFKQNIGCDKVLLTGSCTHALEIIALLLNLEKGDEIIMPSYTFVSTANAFVLHGGKPVFVDINPLTMNIDETLIENAITDKTKAIVIMHYGGVSCDMEKIIGIAKKHNLILIEDAAQAVKSSYKNKPLGSFGDFATFSFHETKNYTSGEGGALIINNKNYTERAEIIHQKGTNRNRFLRGQVDKYTWVDVGSSYVMSELNAAYLYAQLEDSDKIDKKRREIWDIYNEGLQELAKQKKVELPFAPSECKHNSHIFFIKTKDIDERSELIDFMKSKNIYTVFHYVPLHSSPGGLKYAKFTGEDNYTTIESERLLRLPLFYNMELSDTKRVVDAVKEFYKK